MSCTGAKCQCASTEYFVESSLSCLNRTLNNTACSSNNTCRVDLGLSCQSGLCQCDLSAKFWHVAQGKCMDYMTYGDTDCEADNNCIASKNLICNLDATANKCNCNKTSVNNMCDCKRVIDDEYYWDGAKCMPANSYNGTCSNDKMCKTLTDNLKCTSGKCALLLEGKPCTSSAECDFYKFLYCNASQCSCPYDYYWDTGRDVCGKFK